MLPGERGSAGPVEAQEDAARGYVSLQPSRAMYGEKVGVERVSEVRLSFSGSDASLRYPRPLAPLMGAVLCLVVYHGQRHEIDSRNLVCFLWLFLRRGWSGCVCAGLARMRDALGLAT